ncbi:MAG: restriction endonuclease subunit S [Brevundimonas sp.]|uniref:restriction endonuclease subunit S n=1 Tax=Brevundimonas sp. TaxID=1871086 RepID=UPI00181D5399|nr:restriction endonuclease subunit S [Brevundimonas sp.]MBA4804796.1 restriction endonuclease subunit S [Brevundimonas sp.]
MSVPKYGSYRDSGVEWLGEVPAHWKVLKLSRLVDPYRAITYGIVQAGPDIDGGVPYIRPADMSEESGVRDETNLLRTSEDIAAAYRRSTVRAGDIVCSIGPSFGKVMVVPSSLNGANLTQGTARIAVNDDASSRYVFWALRASASVCQWESSIGGATFRSLNLEPLAATLVCCPPKSEQLAVAAFLDRETGKIDALVEAQRRLIELLKEKRQAVISHAVTKGLDPADPMKDSGVGWLGEVPAHWDVVPLKRNLVFLTSGSRGWAEHYADEGALFLRIGNLTRDRVDLDLADIQRVAVPLGSEGERTRVQSGDVLFSITAFLGSVAVVPSELETAFVSQHVALARLAGGRLLPKWVAYVTLSCVGKTQLEMGGYGGTKIQLSLGDVGDLLMTVPPPSEQATILNWLDAKLQEFSTLESEAEKAISLLLERRAALISAAVTGKIDVRGLAPEQAEAA